MKRVVTAVVLIPLVLLAVVRAPIWLFATIVGVVALLATREYLDMVRQYGLEPFRPMVYVFAVLCMAIAGRLGMLPDPGAYLLGTFFFVALLLAMASAVLLALAMRDQELGKALPSAAVSLLALLYIALPLAAIISLRSGRAGWFLVIYLLIIVWAGDIFAYYTGRTVGRHKLAPRLSPNKTWEGAVASLVGAVLMGCVLFRFGPQILSVLARVHLLPGDSLVTTLPMGWVVLLSAGMNIAAQLGDLVESMMKRGAGLKDSGTLVPGHGGLLDRIDALLFAAPVLWYYALISAAIGNS